MNEPTLKNRKQVRFYLTEQNEDRLSHVVNTLGQSETWVTNTLLEAALKAITEGGGRLVLPLRFQLEEAATHADSLRAALPKRKAA